MKKNWLLVAGIAVLLVVAAILIVTSGTANKPAEHHQVSHPQTQSPATAVQTIPAHYEQAPSRASLRPTLEPDKFTGLTRDAYRAAREIPTTIAQMPCYCHCDRGMGHKSLYSCFEDDHASHCATCVNEALLALKLEKELKLPPAQIRDRIIAQFGQ